MKNKFAAIIVLLMVLFCNTCLAAAKIEIIAEGFLNRLSYVYVEGIKKEMANRIACNNKINGDYVVIMEIVPPKNSFEFLIIAKVISEGQIIGKFIARNTLFDYVLSNEKKAYGSGLFAGIFLFVFIKEYDKSNF